MDIYKTASEWLAKGIAVFPVPWRSKTPRVAWAQYQVRLPEPDDLRRWFARPTPINYGIVTGWKGLAVIDFDSFDAFWCWRDWALTDKIACRLVDSYQVVTSRGLHLYIYLDQPAKSIGRPPIEVKASGRYVLGPGSTHPSGWIYTPVDPGAEILRTPSVESLQPEGFFEEVQVRAQQAAVAPARPIQSPKPVSPWDQVELAGPPLPKDAVRQIKSKLGILDLLPNQGWKPSGGYFMTGLCPFHPDAHESAWFDAKHNLFGCHAGCTGSRPWDPINLYAAMNGISLSDAIRELGKQLLQ